MSRSVSRGETVRGRKVLVCSVCGGQELTVTNVTGRVDTLKVETVPSEVGALYQAALVDSHFYFTDTSVPPQSIERRSMYEYEHHTWLVVGVE